MTKKHFGMIFPGQGSQALSMAKELADVYPVVQTTFSQASAVLGYDLWELTQHGPVEQLNQTEFTQPALLTAEYAMWQCWQQETDEVPTILAGHSLGEYTAFLCAGALEFIDAVELVASRGRFMQQAVEAGEGAMAAVIGLEDEGVAELCHAAKIDKEILSPANFNSNGQIVIAGHTASVENAVQMAKSKGAKLAKIIPVSVPSHCALMQPAAEQLAKKIQNIHFKTPTIPVIQNVDALIHQEPEKMKQALIAQLINPVHWVKTLQKIEAEQVFKLVECGPGKVLAGLNKRITKNITTFNFDNQATLQEVVANL